MVHWPGWIHAAEQDLVETERRCEILGLVVDGRRRRGGIGRRLVAEAERWAASRGLRQMSVRSNVVREESHPFYEAQGYAPGQDPAGLSQADRRVRLSGRAVGPAEWRWRVALTGVLAVYGWICLRTPDTFRWLDSLDLAIHETGHLVFAFGGETLTVLGGTLLAAPGPGRLHRGALAPGRPSRGDRAALVAGPELLEHRALRPGRAGARRSHWSAAASTTGRFCWITGACWNATRRSGVRCTWPECSATWRRW